MNTAAYNENMDFLARHKTHIMYCAKCCEYGHELSQKTRDLYRHMFQVHKDCDGTLFISTTTTHEMLDALSHEQKVTLLQEISEKSTQLKVNAQESDAFYLNMVRTEIDRRNRGDRNRLFDTDSVYKRSLLHDPTGVPYCPQCDSLLVQPIRTKKRLFSVGLFGMASDTVGKSMECLSCKYKW